MSERFDLQKYLDQLFPSKRESWRLRLLRARNNALLLAFAAVILGLFGLAVYGHIIAIRACGWGGWFLYGKNLFWAYFWGYCGV